MRRLIAFDCAGDTLVGTLNVAASSTGLLIVSGGNEIRSGAHRGMAALAASVAAAGIPVMRFDRRGVGDSSGANGGFEASGPDIAAAAAAFRAEQPQIARIVGFGNCDAATALALFHDAAGIESLVLANPWVVEGDSALPPPAAIRARYAERLRNPREWLRLISGGVNITKLISGLQAITHKPSQRIDSLAARMAAALAASNASVTLLIAERDNTAIAFLEQWQSPTFAELRARAAVHRRDTASHSFAGDDAWLLAQVLQALN